MLNVFRPLLLITAISLAGLVFAQDPPAEPRSQEPRSQREDAGNRVRQVEREGGRVLQAEPMQRGGRETYRIKVLTPEGRVRVLEEGRGRDARPTRDERRDSRERATLRDRQRQRDPEVRRADPPPDAAERPRRGDDGDSRRN